MSVIAELASSIGKRDEAPNIDLAIRIITKKNSKAITELVDCLPTAKKDIRSDAIKVIYEIGERKPELIAEHVTDFISLLVTNDNRLLWGLVTALDTITLIKPKEVYRSLSAIIDASNQGSVIAKDHAVGILIKLATVKAYASKVLPLLFDELKQAPENQFPMYAEQTAPIITDSSKAAFASILTARLKKIDKESKKKRIEKVLKKLGA